MALDVKYGVIRVASTMQGRSLLGSDPDIHRGSDDTSGRLGPATLKYCRSGRIISRGHVPPNQFLQFSEMGVRRQHAVWVRVSGD